MCSPRNGQVRSGSSILRTTEAWKDGTAYRGICIITRWRTAQESYGSQSGCYSRSCRSRQSSAHVTHGSVPDSAIADAAATTSRAFPKTVARNAARLFRLMNRRSNRNQMSRISDPSRWTGPIRSLPVAFRPHVRISFAPPSNRRNNVPQARTRAVRAGEARTEKPESK
jgi:hypothetical protein